MFFKWKKEAEENVDKIYSPVHGETIPLENVKDEVFSKKLLGDGVAFVFEEDTVYSPCDGKINMIATTKHAFGIQTANGTEILLHVGLDTVNLNGKGMELLVKKNDKIKKNQPVLKVDREFMDKNHVDMTIILLITNQKNVELIFHDEKQVDLKSVVLESKKTS